jgi:hypothetical protein
MSDNNDATLDDQCNNDPCLNWSKDIKTKMQTLKKKEKRDRSIDSIEHKSNKRLKISEGGNSSSILHKL